MTEVLFSVFDSAAKGWLRTFQAPTLEVGIRQFRLTVNDPKSMFNRFPEDYILFAVGEFDIQTGQLTAYPAPHSCGVAALFVERAEASVPALRAAEPIQEMVDNGA